MFPPGTQNARRYITMDQKYTIGVDFGTLSARALVVRTCDGKEMADAVMDYPHRQIGRWRIPTIFRSCSNT